MSEHESPDSKRKKALAAVARHLKNYKRGLTLGGLCLVVTNLLMLANPWILKVTIDGLQAGTTSRELLNYAIAFVGITVASGVFRFLMRRIMIGISRKIELDMRGEYFAHLESLSPSFYNQHRTGDLMALATNDLNAVRSLVGPGVMYSLNTVVVSAMTLSLMIVLSWRLTVVALLPMAILAVGMYHSMKLIHKYFEKVQERFGGLNSRAQENLSGVRVVRAYAREDYETAEFEKHSRIYVDANMKLYRIQSLLSPLLTSVAGLGGLFILAYGGKQVIDQAITLGTLVAFIGYMTMLVWPMIALGWVMNIMERGLASMGRINAILHTKPEIKDDVRSDAGGIPVTDCSLSFENVSFSYDASQDRAPVLCDISFSVRDGETVAIVGPTGSGKTSLVSLILRLYRPQTGTILVGGVPIEEISLSDLRTVVGLIPQDIFLFSQSIAENVAFGVPRLEESELDRLSRVAAIYGEVQNFPHKYQTVIGERGINLSGGQKQRIAIARALAKKPGILILDDALSSVDTDTEERILRSLRDEMKQRTSILISHRISTVREADRILVLNEGKLVEAGTHQELIASRGLYADMYDKQQIMYSLERS
ncbi:MAG: ABC transporter ATP-binding protein/permease [Candidatus Krumholzibacteria bacterium]|nr:ABC transporter ATP-binding protein/permease [Candidatus Krumholzibacteria bacterium]